MDASRQASDPVIRAGRAVTLAGVIGVAALSWAYLIHQDWAMRHMDIVAMAMPGPAAWGVPDLLLVFVMWSVMMVAMMLPAAAPTVMLFASVNRQRHAPRSPARTAIFVSGYLAVWTGFSVLATLGQWGLHAASLLSPTMLRTTPFIGGVLLIAAGIYQWTPFKQVCLAHCRSPLGFIMNHWRDGIGGAFLTGLRHGLYCLGCCWLLMTLLFAAGVMNLLWIAALSLLVLLEKTIPGGAWVAKGAGLAFVASGGWLVFGAI